MTIARNPKTAKNSLRARRCDGVSGMAASVLAVPRMIPGIRWMRRSSSSRMVPASPNMPGLCLATTEHPPGVPLVFIPSDFAKAHPCGARYKIAGFAYISFSRAIMKTRQTGIMAIIPKNRNARRLLVSIWKFFMFTTPIACQSRYQDPPCLPSSPGKCKRPAFAPGSWEAALRRK